MDSTTQNDHDKMMTILSNELQKYYIRMNAEHPDQTFLELAQSDAATLQYESDDESDRDDFDKFGVHGDYYIIEKLDEDPEMIYIGNFDENFPLKKIPKDEAEECKLIMDVFHEIINNTDKLIIPSTTNSFYVYK